MKKLPNPSPPVKLYATDVLLLSFEPQLGLSGVNAYVRAAALYLAAEGLRVLVLALAPSPTLSLVVRTHGTLRVASLGYVTVAGLLTTVDRLVTGSVVAVHCQEDRLLGLAAEISRRFDARLFHTVHYVHPETSRHIVRHRPTVVAVSEAVSGELALQEAGFEVVVIPNFADARWATRSGLEHRGRALRRAAGVTDEAPVILFAGRANARQKGADLLVRAVEHLLERFPALVVAFAGTYWLPPDVRDVANRLEPCIRVLGMLGRGSLHAWYRVSDVVAVPSRYEPFGLTALEAQTVGTPVVAASVDGLREVVHPGMGALVPTVGGEVDPATLARALASILNRHWSPGERTTLSRWTVSRFGADAHLRSLLGLYGLQSRATRPRADRPASQKRADASIEGRRRPIRQASNMSDLDIESTMVIARRHAAVFARNGDERDELAAEAASRAWESRARFDPRRGSIEQWVFGVVRNIAREWQRDRQRQRGLRWRLLGSRNKSPSAAETDELADLRAAFGQLDERQQHLIYLRYWRDLPYRTIAQEVGISEVATRQIVRRALVRLGRLLR